MRWADFGTGVFFVLLGIFVLWTGRDLPISGEGRPGPGMLPVATAITFIVLGGALAVKQLVRPSTDAFSNPGRGGFSKVAAAFGLLVFGVVLLEPLGFILASALMLAGILLGVERKFTVASAAVILALPPVLWIVFARLLGLRLPEGLLSF